MHGFQTSVRVTRAACISLADRTPAGASWFILSTPGQALARTTCFSLTVLLPNVCVPKQYLAPFGLYWYFVPRVSCHQEEALTPFSPAPRDRALLPCGVPRGRGHLVFFWACPCQSNQQLPAKPHPRLCLMVQPPAEPGTREGGGLDREIISVWTPWAPCHSVQSQANLEVPDPT